MNCSCPPNYTLVGETCIKTTVISDIECPVGCELVMTEDGNAYCSCEDSIDPIETQIKTPIYFDNTNYFKDVSFTISYKPNEGWNSYFSFYPDFSVAHNGFFQTGFNWGISKGTMWNHTLQNDSFSVFQGVKHGFALEFPIASEGVDKILNSLSINVEARHYINHYDYSVSNSIGISDLFIYNSTTNSGYLVLHNQKSLTDSRKYPYVDGNKQHILSTNENGKQTANYIYNRVLDQNNNIPIFKRDSNNIFKDIDSRAVKFGGKKVLERMRGDTFIVNLSNTQSSQFQILIKNIISNETTE